MKSLSNRTSFALISFGIILLLNLISVTASSQDVAGKKLFRDYCKACHSIDQNLVGPSLKDVHKRRAESWIFSFIKGSQAMVESGDSVAVALFNQFNKIPMPDQKLNDQEIALVLDYIKVESLPKNLDDNPIKRPEVVYSNVYAPFSFSSFLFWIPFTITVFLILGLVYYMTVLTDLKKEKEQ